jgi:hypothetical protein
MNAFLSSFWAEALKMRRSRVTLGIAAGFLILPIIAGLFMYILKDPEQARAMGLIGAKARLLTEGTADWPSFFQFLSLGTAVAGAMLFAFITTWVFGREFSDHTVKELLALPTPRTVIVSAKFLLIALWILALTFFIFIVALGIGAVVDIPGWSPGLAWTSFLTIMITSILTTLLMPLVALFASAGRGYLPPLGWAVLTVVIAQVAGVMGWASWVPWAVPGLFSMMFSVMYGQSAEPIGIHSIILLLITFIVGLSATYAWWRGADQSR